MSIASDPTPPDAPVTQIGPCAGDCLFSSMRNSASAAVNPAVPRTIASRSDSPAGSRIAQSDSRRAYSA